MPYIPPEEVHSPKAKWHLHEVIIPGGPGTPAYALGTWDRSRVIGFRWNGDDQSPLGNPQSRGLPTWTILDERLNEAVVALLHPLKAASASLFLGIKHKPRTKLV